MVDPVKNFAKVTVSIPYDNLATSILLNSGDGIKLPYPSTDGAFNLVWWNSTDYPDPSDDPNKEIVRCTAISTDTLTVTRAQESTSATNKNTVGKTYKMVLSTTAKTITDLESKGSGMAYRTSAFNLSAAGTWYDIPLDGGDANLVNVTHSTLTNPERVTVNVAGTYLINYKVHVRRQGTSHHTVGRLYKNGTTEVLGSFTIQVMTTSDVNENNSLFGTVLASLSANDYVTIQAGTNMDVANEVDVYDDPSLPDPTTRIYAILTIIKIGT